MRTLGFVIFFAVTALVTGLGHLYLYRRLVVPTTRSKRSRRIALGVLVFLWLGLVFARVLKMVVGGAVARAAAIGFWVWFALALYLGISLFVADLVRLGRWLAAKVRRVPVEPVDDERRLLLARSVAGLSALVSVGVSGYGVHSAFGEPEISEVPVKLPGLPRALDGFTLVQISDLHVGDILGKDFLRELVERCNALKPDLLAITGDLVDGSVRELMPAIAELNGLRSRHGTYFCTGNHDYYSGADAWCAALSRMGVTVLRNRFVPVGEAGASFDLFGVDDWGARKSGYGTGYDLDRAVRGRNPERASVLLAHQPANLEAVSAAGLGLQLSGHTHGGQMWPFTDLVSLRWPMSRGRFTVGGTTLYVSRGTGFWGAPMRVDSPPEIVKVVLTA